MSDKQKHQSRGRRRMTNHSTFKKLRQSWAKRTPFNDWDSFQTKHFEPQAFMRALDLAAVANLSATDACDFYRGYGEDVPSGELLLLRTREVPPAHMELYINWALREQFNQLPTKVRRDLRREGTVVIDFHQDPYYGDLDNPHISGGKPKKSAKYFYTYLTADICSKRGSQTIAVLFRPPNASTTALFGDLLALVEAVCRPKLILMDGEFASTEIFKQLQAQGYQYIGRKAITPVIQPLALAYQLTDGWEAKRQFHAVQLRSSGSRTRVTTYITFQLARGQFRALAVSPRISLSVDDAVQTYRRRFTIESGYRDKHLFQPRTTSKHLSVRLLLFYFACAMWNLWHGFLLAAYPRQLTKVPRFNRVKRHARIVRLLWLVTLVT